MTDINLFKQQLFKLQHTDFEAYALQLFRYQAQHNPVYRQYLELLDTPVSSIQSIHQIPFLPIALFKQHQVLTIQQKPTHIFTSSGTTGSISSRHPIIDINLYHQSFSHAFRYFYGDPKQYCLLALLPAYLERKGSSLVYMAHHLIQQTQHPDSDFYLYNYKTLIEKLKTLEAKQQPSILLGVSFALWDLAEQYAMPLKHTIVMETGGMKGRRKEIVREALHDIYKAAFGVSAIHSEYGMTELLSQAYSKGDGIFQCPPWMKVLTRDITDPFSDVAHGATGAINVIDLANIYSCAFIATQDMGKVFNDGSFSVLGRMDHSDTRGCNLMV